MAGRLVNRLVRRRGGFFHRSKLIASTEGVGVFAACKDSGRGGDFSDDFGLGDQPGAFCDTTRGGETREKLDVRLVVLRVNSMARKLSTDETRTIPLK